MIGKKEDQKLFPDHTLCNLIPLIHHLFPLFLLFKIISSLSFQYSREIGKATYFIGFPTTEKRS